MGFDLDHLNGVGSEGAEQRKRIHYDFLALCWAASAGEVDDVRELVGNNPGLCQMRIQEYPGQSVVHLAAANGKTLALDELLPHADIDARDALGRTALHYAAAAGYSLAVETLIGAGADIEASDENGFTALYEAIDKGMSNTAARLIDLGSDPFAETSCHFTPIQNAALKADQFVLSHLIETGRADACMRFYEGKTLLHSAIESCDPWMIDWLVANGADVNQVSDNGESALHVAAWLGKEEIIMLLLYHEADTAVRTTEGYLPINIACQEGHTGVVEMLMEYEA